MANDKQAPWRWRRYVIPKRLLPTSFHGGFLLGLLFYPDDGGDMFLRNICLSPAFTLVSCAAYFIYPEDGDEMFLRNVGWLSTDHTALYPRRWYTSQPPLWEPQILHETIKVFINILISISNEAEIPLWQLTFKHMCKVFLCSVGYAFWWWPLVTETYKDKIYILILNLLHLMDLKESRNTLSGTGYRLFLVNRTIYSRHN
jgi:hypothetical protein